MSVTAISTVSEMARWEPNAQDRLQVAAMELFQERGYDGTTVAEIAARAGLTERTFFRYFTDKREVLFSRAKELEAALVAFIAAAPPKLSPFEAVVAGLESLGPGFESRRVHSRQRQRLLAEHAELHERELNKLASLAAATAECLQTRGIAKATAQLIGETSMALFRSAFEQWVEDAEQRDLGHHLRVALADLRAATAAPPHRTERESGPASERESGPAPARTSERATARSARLVGGRDSARAAALESALEIERDTPRESGRETPAALPLANVGPKRKPRARKA